MEDTHREFLEQQRDEAARKRDELDVVVRYLNSLLGVTEEPSKAATTGASTRTPVPATGSVVAIVNEGEFFGLSAPKATRALLQKVGKSRPLKTAEIFEAITKGGVTFKSKEGLYRSLGRDETFYKVGGGRWGLADWYPNVTRKQREPDGEPTSPGISTETEPVTVDAATLNGKGNPVPEPDQI